MPVVGPVPIGDALAASATTTMTRPVALDADAGVLVPAGTQVDPALDIGYMPGMRVWVLQTDALANPATVAVRVATQPDNAGGGGDNWQTIGTFMTTPGVSNLVPFSFPGARMQLVLTRAAGVATNLIVSIGSIAGG